MFTEHVMITEAPPNILWDQCEKKREKVIEKSYEKSGEENWFLARKKLEKTSNILNKIFWFI